MNNDVVRYSQPEANIIVASKFFENLKINSMQTQNSFTINEIDVQYWITHSVLLNNNYTVQGLTRLQNPIISHIESFGPVNGQKFSSENILLKTENQQINQNVHIGSHEDPLKKLTFDSIYLNNLNNQNFSHFYETLVQRPPPNQPLVANIYANLQFTESVRVDNLQCNGQMNGVDFKSLTDLNHNQYNQQYRSALPELYAWHNETLLRRHELKHNRIMDHFVLRQTMPSNKIIQLNKLFNTKDENGNDAFVVVSASENGTRGIDFISWDRQIQKFSLIKSMKKKRIHFMTPKTLSFKHHSYSFQIIN